jgi:hypothetical protein
MHCYYYRLLIKKEGQLSGKYWDIYYSTTNSRICHVCDESYGHRYHIDRANNEKGIPASPEAMAALTKSLQYLSPNKGCSCSIYELERIGSLC